jgi:crotonobetainyl-CoA:carnitine CoA-transferase CaiB-like acyl-CoA transferase
LTDPQLATRRVLHEHAKVEGIEGPVTVPMTAFRFAHGGPSLETPPPRLGQHTDEILQTLGYFPADIAALRAEGAI